MTKINLVMIVCANAYCCMHWTALTIGLNRSFMRCGYDEYGRRGGGRICGHVMEKDAAMNN